MSQTANKGEWSELYVLLKLLADGQLQPGDAYLGSSDTAALKVLQVVRQDSSGPISYRLGTENISIETTAGTRQLVVAKARAWANDLLAAIQTDTGEKGAKSIPAASIWMQALGTTAIKAKSADKADIEVVLHDLQTGGAPKLGFSVKSYLGGAPTLLNASGQTNICYHLPSPPCKSSESLIDIGFMG